MAKNNIQIRYEFNNFELRHQIITKNLPFPMLDKT